MLAGRAAAGFSGYVDSIHHERQPELCHRRMLTADAQAIGIETRGIESHRVDIEATGIGEEIHRRVLAEGGPGNAFLGEHPIDHRLQALSASSGRRAGLAIGDDLQACDARRSAYRVGVEGTLVLNFLPADDFRLLEIEPVEDFPAPDHRASR